MDNHRSKAHAARPTLPPTPGLAGQGGHAHGAPKHGGHGGQMGHHHGGPSGARGHLPPAPGGAAGYSRNPPPQPAKQITPKETDEIVKRTKGKLFEKLQPLLKGDQTDFTVDSHNGRVEFCFPCSRPGSVMQLVRTVCDYATHESGSGAPANEVCVAMLREKFMVVRIREQSAPRFGAVYRLEVMLPIEGVGQGLVMAVAQSLKPEDIGLCEQLYKLAGGHSGGAEGGEGAEEGSGDQVQEAVEKLRSLGVDVWVPKDQMEQEEGKVRKPSPEAEAMWAGIAGYEQVKTQVKQSITLPLLRPDVFARMSAITRGGTGSGKNTSGVLFTGPPGVGKTSMAKVASHVACTPLVYVPVESIVSKWYGEAEQKLRAVFEATRKLGSAVLFLDELDAFAGSRDSNMHEVTRRILCVLLRQLDGLESDTKEGEEKKLTRVVLVGATNRPTDLDAALRSRFNKMVDFPLPDAETRAAIFATYATTLQADDLGQLGEQSEGFAGRDIRECCDDAEHRFVAHLLDNEGGYEMKAEDLRPPGVEDYLAAIRSRKINPENGC